MANTDVAENRKAEARYKNGVLTIRLPKVGGEKSKAIPVS